MAKKNSGTVAVATPKGKKTGNAAIAVTPASKSGANKAFEPMKVIETINVSPLKLHLREQKLRGRSKDVSTEELYTLADSMVKNGQQQALQIRPLKGSTDEYEVIFGNTRTLAGRELVKGFKFTVNSKEVEQQPIPDFTLRAEVVDVDDEEAFLRTAIENAQRFQTSDIDDAINHETLRNDYSMSDAAITRLYGYGHQASVTQLKKLLALPQDLQDRIHRGDMTKQAGFILVDWARKKGHIDADSNKVKQDVSDAIMKEVKGGEDIGNVGSSEIANCIRAYEKAITPTATPPGEPTAPVGNPNDPNPAGSPEPVPQQEPTKFALTLKEWKDTLTEFAGVEDVPAKVAEFATTTLSFMKGETDKAAYYEWLTAHLGNAE